MADYKTFVPTNGYDEKYEIKNEEQVCLMLNKTINKFASFEGEITASNITPSTKRICLVQAGGFRKIIGYEITEEIPEEIIINNKERYEMYIPLECNIIS